MNKSKTITRLLRRLGVALIVAPEPFTTPFGVTLILLARYLSRRREDSLNTHLRETVEYYLAHTMCFGDAADGESSAPGSVKRYTHSLSFEANLAPSVWQSWRDMRGRTAHHTKDMPSSSPHYKAGESFKVESGWSDTSRRAEKVIHHAINMKWLCQRYEGQGSVAAHANWARTSGAGEGVTHHSVNMKLLSQRYQTGNVGQTRVKSHTINKALLRQHYGPAVSYTTALNALQNNNFFYDVLSRGNVIGGY